MLLLGINSPFLYILGLKIHLFSGHPQRLRSSAMQHRSGKLSLLVLLRGGEMQSQLESLQRNAV